MELEKNKSLKYLLFGAIGVFLFIFGQLFYYFAMWAATNIKQNIGFASFLGSLMNNPAAVSIFQYVAYIPFLIVMLFLLKNDFKEDFKEVKKNWKNIVLYVGCGFILMYMLTIVVSMVYQSLGIFEESANEQLINEILLSKYALPMIVSVVLLAPIVEEIVFRKLLFGFCEHTLKLKPVFAVLISALIFAFIHVSDLENIKFIFQYLPLSLVICSVYHFSKNNIYAAILIHMANNTVAVIVTYLAAMYGI